MRFHNFLLLISLASTPLFAATAYHNQVGFPTKGVKQLAVVGAEGKDIIFKDSTKQTVLTVKAPAAAYWKPANENASLVDFSEIQKPGTYVAYLGDSAISHPIIISDKVLEDVTVASLRWFYYQRASMELTEEFAGIYARPMGHPDTAARYHSLLGKELMATFASPKGWYDAGDYG
jgi:endoglucanase